MSKVRTLAGKAWRRLRQPQKPETAEITSSAWYDKAFSEVSEYRLPYWESRYYFAWTVIADRIRQSNPPQRVLEIGCGTGQLAQLLIDTGVTDYLGFDFSRVAIDLARMQTPAGAFVVADARHTPLLDEGHYDWIVCTEVLEHVEFDTEVISRIPEDRRVICTVPSFDYVSHVRFFDSAEAVRDRYSPFFDEFSVLSLRMPGEGDHTYFLFAGVRNGAKADSDSSSVSTDDLVR